MSTVVLIVLIVAVASVAVTALRLATVRVTNGREAPTASDVPYYFVVAGDPRRVGRLDVPGANPTDGGSLEDKGRQSRSLSTLTASE